MPGWLREVLEARERDDEDDERRESARQRDRQSPEPDRGRSPGASAPQGERLDWRGGAAASRLDARAAAREARERYGGRVLAVKRRGDAYRVRLLLDEGRVTTVTIEE